MSGYDDAPDIAASQDRTWVDIQKRTFTGWMNSFLTERMMKINDLETDLEDGIPLINLLEIISSKKFPNYNKRPRLKPQKLENCSLCIRFLTNEGLKLVAIGPEDLVDHRLKLILGLIWTIILRYQIQRGDGSSSAKKELLEWVRSKIPEYNVKNFTNSWQDGKAICALAEVLNPGMIDLSQMNNKGPHQNATTGIDAAEEHMDIPKILDPADMVSPNSDELSVMTYISYFRDYEENEGAKRKRDEFERTVVPGECIAYGPGLEGGETADPGLFTIQAKNGAGRNVPQGGENFDVQVKGPNGNCPVKVDDNNDGTYSVEYQPSKEGNHLITVQLKGQPIKDSPWNVHIDQSGPVASQCNAFGPGLQGGDTAHLAEFTIQSRNKHGDPITRGGDPFVVKVRGPYGDDVPATVRDNNNGTYAVSYDPLDVGNHHIDATLNGAPIQDSPFDVDISPPRGPHDPDPNQCRAYGPGLERGNTAEPALFTIEAINYQGQRIPVGGHPFSVDVEGPRGEVPCSLKDNGDGTYSCEYQPKFPGNHKVSVKLHRKNPLYFDHIKDSPFNVPIDPGTDAAKTIAYGPGLEGGVDNQPSEFKIKARDTLGNDVNKGGDPFEVAVDGPAGPVPAKITDNDDGTYDVVYEPDTAGDHTVRISLKGDPVANSPYHLTVREGADWRTSCVEDFEFTVQSKTKSGQRMTRGGENFTAEITGTQNVPVRLDDRGDGTYIGRYTLNQNGNYQIHVAVNGHEIKGSPWNQSH